MSTSAGSDLLVDLEPTHSIDKVVHVFLISSLVFSFVDVHSFHGSEHLSLGFLLGGPDIFVGIWFFELVLESALDVLDHGLRMGGHSRIVDRFSLVLGEDRAFVLWMQECVLRDRA